MTYEIFDPYDGAPDNSDPEQWLGQQGWTEFLGIGSDGSSLHIRSFRRNIHGRDEFIVDVWDAVQGSPFIKVENFGVLMDLFARWAPAVQAASLMYVIDSMQSYDLSNSGVVETVAAKAAYGADDGLDALRSHEREQAARRREIAERRKAAGGSGP